MRIVDDQVIPGAHLALIKPTREYFYGHHKGVSFTHGITLMLFPSKVLINILFRM